MTHWPVPTWSIPPRMHASPSHPASLSVPDPTHAMPCYAIQRGPRCPFPSTANCSGRGGQGKRKRSNGPPARVDNCQRREASFNKVVSVQVKPRERQACLPTSMPWQATTHKNANCPYAMMGVMEMMGNLVRNASSNGTFESFPTWRPRTRSPPQKSGHLRLLLLC
jgi:hypothetical protein